MNIADIRKDYKLQTLLETDVSDSPISQFDKWWGEAVKSNIEEVNAMTLATADAAGIPEARIVLLKGYDENGFVFFTNYKSQKGISLLQNPNACMVFFWKELERQVRITGTVAKVSSAASDAYYETRPLSSRIGAWASAQSQVIANRNILEEQTAALEAQYANTTIPRPPHWGGYVVQPQQIEFWQGRPSRLHDRIRYSLQKNGIWIIERLAP